MLTPERIVYYLIERGYVGLDTVVDGDFLVVDYRRRNRNFQIICRKRPGLFVKQVQSMEPEPISTLQREANCYWLVQTQPALAPLARMMPKFVGYDPLRHVLAIELLGGAETLTEYQRRLGRLPQALTAELGGLLGNYHRDLGAWIMESQYRALFPQAVPWILTFHKMRPEYFRPLSAGNARLLELVQSYTEFHEALDTLHAEWKVNGLVHGDMKWENCLVQTKLLSSDHAMPQDGGNPAITLKLVDWEMADLGDPCWDVGALLQSFLVFWILSLPLAGQVEPAQLIEMAQHPLNDMQPSIRSFWRGYRGAMSLDAGKAKDLLLRCVRFSGARMIQSTFECLYFAPDITPQAICLLQVSLNILKDPAGALENLLGIRGSDA